MTQPTGTRVCGVCEKPAPYRTVATNVPCAKPVVITSCPRCDFRQCEKCKQPCEHTSSRCPNGHLL